MLKRLLIIIASIMLISTCSSFKRSPDVGNKLLISAQGVAYKYMYCDESKLNYLITYPKDYDPENSTYPLILYLHSMAERGSELNKLIYNEEGQGNGLSKYAIENKIDRFVTISPLCPPNSYWSFLTKKINKLLINVTRENSIDLEKIYLTGVSMGGMGTWSVAMKYPEWFAAIAPISGGIYKPFMSENIGDIQNIPIWIFHDKYDNEIPIGKTANIIKKLDEVKADVQITMYEEGEHYLNEKVFEDGKIFEWFLHYTK